MLRYGVVGFLFLLALVAGPLLWDMADSDRDSVEPAAGLPWQIVLTADGDTRVFGLMPGSSRIDDALAVFGDDIDIAIVAPPARPARLEAYFSAMRAGFVTGKLVLTVDVPDDVIDAMRERAVRSTYMESAARKYALHSEDLVAARAAPIRVITFIPSVDLDEAVIIARFGEPAMRIDGSDGVEHFLYPPLGLDIALSTRGKEVFQYVAPRDFALLRDPLMLQD
ncbi:MAG TPA: hypothetical protein PK725_07275 [Rhodocyclaceae bacterium]|nr:hypothetical protein [Rhodocyclaceae bacterium]HRQ46735.1 hypothetical protein [Rhodocyclaceae bacterium]